MGKYVDMEVDLESVLKRNNDPGNKNLYQRQKELKYFIKLIQGNILKIVNSELS